MVALPDAEVGYVQRSPSQLEYRVGFRKLTSAVAIDFQRQAKICVSKVERVGNVNSFRLVSDVYRAIHRWMPASETQQMRFGKLISPFYYYDLRPLDRIYWSLPSHGTVATVFLGDGCVFLPLNMANHDHFISMAELFEVGKVESARR